MGPTLEQMLRTVDNLDYLNKPVGLQLRLGIVAGLLRTAPPGTGPRLLWRSGGNEVQSRSLEHDLLVGRDPRCDLVLNSRLVSRKHCQFQNRAGTIWLEDLGSTHGTLVNEQQVQHCTLNDGDIIQIGGMALVFTAS